MNKEFNDTGLCIPDRHYMVDTSGILKQTIDYIDKGKYFIINRPRQYGKTTLLETLYNDLDTMNYTCIFLSFESGCDENYKNIQRFSDFFLEQLYKSLKIIQETPKVDSFKDLSDEITRINNLFEKKIVLLIDEIDKSSNNDLFIHFLSMLRNKYLIKHREKTFHSIILAGLHDIKTLKLKLRSDDEEKYNSPWNIAADYKVDLSFSPTDIETMLVQYCNETNAAMNTKDIAEKLYFYTSGYPYFVSKLCKIIDEEMEVKNDWKEEHVIEAIKILLSSINNTNFDTVIKNLENNDELNNFIKKVIIYGMTFDFAIQVPIINFANINGMIKNENGKVRIHNKIYEVYISEYFIGKANIKNNDFNSIQSIYLKPDGHLDIKKVLIKFQEAIKEKYSKTDIFKSDEFLENDLRMLFLMFLKPIINGTGFSFKEVQTSAERRLDIVVIFLDEKFIIEVKLWYGDEYHKQGIEQIKDYMQREGCKEGYMVIMSKNKNKKFTATDEDGLFTIWL